MNIIAESSLQLERARAGDSAAFADLVRSHQSAVRQQLRRLTQGDAALADDLAQETFVQAWLHLGAFRGEARFSTWLYRLAYHRFLMQRRARRAEPVDLPETANTAGSPALKIDVDKAVARLPEHERIAIIHCYQLDLTHDEAAVVLGLPLGTLKSHVQRGKAHLRELLAAYETKEMV